MPICRAELRDSIGYAFRELLLNAVEWGGKLDPKRKVRIACLRDEAHAPLPHCRSGPGLQDRGLPHAAIGQSPDDPIGHMQVREEKGSARAVSACSWSATAWTS